MDTALDEKLKSLRECIKQGWDEDAMNHCFDLLRALRVRNTPDFELTADGLKLKAFLQVDDEMTA